MGFVEFEKPEHALVALRALNNNPDIYTGGRLYIEFAIDDLKKIHNMRFKNKQNEQQNDAVSHNRIQKIYSKVENDEVKERIERVLGSAQPKFIGGFNQQFAYKGFDLSLFMNFSVGNKVYNANKIEFTTQYLYRDNNMLTLVNNRFRRFDDNGALINWPFGFFL